jgi:hypothetical protein
MMPMAAQKRRMGDRRDGTWVRDADPLHAFTPYLMPNRADNEAFLSEPIETAPIYAYLERKNAELGGVKLTMFHVILAALVKTVTLRPKMNRFVKGGRLYQRNAVSAAFVVKKQFADDGGEALAFREFAPETTFNQLHAMLTEEITQCRKEDALDNSTAAMGVLTKMPRWVLRIIVHILNRLDYYGRVPQSLIKADPNHATVMLSNLGSVGLNSAYHHLSNWGTNSIFVVIGKKHLQPFYDADGKVEMREVVDLGLTLDERIADGYYYSKTIKLLRYILEHPDVLDQPANTKVEM